MHHARPFQLICRELGLALAVLGLWMLVVLAPLHQSAGLLKTRLLDGQDIQAAALILCGPSQDDSGAERPTMLCPVQALAKAALDLDAGEVGLGAPVLGAGLRLWPETAVQTHAVARLHAEARGPPHQIQA